MSPPIYRAILLNGDPLLSRGCEDYNRIRDLNGTCHKIKRNNRRYTVVLFPLTTIGPIDSLIEELRRRFPP